LRAACSLCRSHVLNKEDFICTICLDLPLNQVMQCSNGHLICQECHQKVLGEACPTCRVEGPRARSLVAERVVSTIKFACVSCGQYHKREALECPICSTRTCQSNFEQHIKCHVSRAVQLSVARSDLRPNIKWSGTIVCLLVGQTYMLCDNIRVNDGGFVTMRIVAASSPRKMVIYVRTAVNTTCAAQLCHEVNSGAVDIICCPIQSLLAVTTHDEIVFTIQIKSR
jgi:hypothetical protein